MIRLFGRLKENILIVHSKNLSNAVRANNNRISLTNYLNGLKLSPLGNIHATIASEKRLQISIGNLLKKNIITITKEEIPVYILPEEWNLEEGEILLKGKGLPLSKEIPKEIISKKGAIRKSKKNYYLDISSKRLSEIARKEIIKVLFNREGGRFILIKSNDPKARKLTPNSKKRIQIAIPKEMLNEREIKELSSKHWFPVLLQLNLKSFGLEIKDFFSISEERKIVETLTEKGMKIKIKDPSDPYDFLINENIGIEVHNSLPKYGDLVTRHKIKPGMVRLRILEADFLTKEKIISRFFVILNKKWEESKYIQELINSINKNAIVLFTNFEKDWDKETSEEIIKRIK